MAKKIVTLLFWTVLLAWIISLFVCLTSLSAIRNNKEMNSIYVFWVVIPSMATYRYLTIINGLLLILEIFSTVIPLKRISIFRAYLRPHLIILLVVFCLLVMYYFFFFFVLLCVMYSIWFSLSFLTAFYFYRYDSSKRNGYRNLIRPTI